MSLSGVIPLAITGAVLAAVVYFRRELGETGSFIGQGLSGLAKGVSAIGSVSLTPTFRPTIGFDFFGAQVGASASNPASMASAAPATNDNVTINQANREQSDSRSQVAGGGGKSSGSGASDKATTSKVSTTVKTPTNINASTKTITGSSKYAGTQFGSYTITNR